MARLITCFQEGQLDEARPGDDTHYHGLAASVLFNLESVVQSSDAARAPAFALCVAMSLLHGTLTPASLFRAETKQQRLQAALEQLHQLEEDGSSTPTEGWRSWERPRSCSRARS